MGRLEGEGYKYWCRASMRWGEYGLPYMTPRGNHRPGHALIVPSECWDGHEVIISWPTGDDELRNGYIGPRFLTVGTPTMIIIFEGFP